MTFDDKALDDLVRRILLQTWADINRVEVADAITQLRSELSAANTVCDLLGEERDAYAVSLPQWKAKAEKADREAAALRVLIRSIAYRTDGAQGAVEQAINEECHAAIAAQEKL